jgi:cell division protein FtsW (lipid II flippase)
VALAPLAGVRPGGLATIAAMLLAAMLFATGKVWHYWVGLVLLVAAILSVLAMVAGYLRKVETLRHPKRNQRR